MLIPLQIFAINVIAYWMLSLPSSQGHALTLQAPTYLRTESAQIEAHANGRFGACFSEHSLAGVGR
jgi:hypothetical protein